MPMKKLKDRCLDCNGFCCTRGAFHSLDIDPKEVERMKTLGATIIPDGKELIILQGDWSTYEFTDDPTNYKYKNNNFIKNLDKINEKENKKIKKQEQEAELKFIEQRMRAMAIEVLKAEGETISHYNDDGSLKEE